MHRCSGVKASQGQEEFIYNLHVPTMMKMVTNLAMPNGTVMDTVDLIAPQHYKAGYIALSYFVSLVGSLTTLELLQQRTSRRGLHNWYLLIGSSITMGGIGMIVFCLNPINTSC